VWTEVKYYETKKIAGKRKDISQDTENKKSDALGRIGSGSGQGVD
jgi:hypothetical protein